jgi:hypothetical protein
MADFKNQNLLHTQNNIDFYAKWNYPKTVRAIEIGTEDGVIHLIFAPIDCSSLLTAVDGTGFGSAPYGSVIFQSVSGTERIYQLNSAGSFKYGATAT